MKKGAVKYIVGGCIVAVGIILVSISYCIGGFDVMSFHGIDIGPDGIHYYYSDGNENTTGGSTTMDNIKAGDIKNLKVSIYCSDVTIKRADVEDILIETSNIVSDKFKYYVKGDTFDISYKRSFTVFG